MQLKDGFNITVSVIERMREVFSMLPDEEKKGCALCNEKLTDVVKRIEAEAQVSNREACRFVGAAIGKGENTVRSAVSRVQGPVDANAPKKDTKRQPISIVEKVSLKVDANTSNLDACRQVAEETGKPLATVRSQVQRAKSKSVFNKSDIEWCDFSWNPVTGCHHNCPYCYARGIATRFTDIFPQGFDYHVREERFSAPDNQPPPKPGQNKVFVCSMADLFGDWVEESVINEILGKVDGHPEWTFIFLTKNSKRLTAYTFPENAWIGVTVDKQDDLPPALISLNESDALVKFISFEPLLEEIEVDVNHVAGIIDWVIIGCESGNRKGRFIPMLSYISNLADSFSDLDIPVFLKPNVALSFPQEFPS